MKHKTSKHLDFVIYYILQISGYSIAIGYQAQTKLLFLIISEQSEEIYHTFALCPLPFYLFLHFALIKNTAPAASEVMGI